MLTLQQTIACFLPGFVEEFVRFGTTLDRSGLDSIGAVTDLIGGDDLQQHLPKPGSAATLGPLQWFSKRPQRLHGSFETLTVSAPQR
jgi:hypothetical protein